MPKESMKDNITDAIHDLGYKIMTGVGGGIGIAYSFVQNHTGEMVLTLLLGFIGAGGAGLAKFLIDKYLYKKVKSNNDETD